MAKAKKLPKFRKYLDDVVRHIARDVTRSDTETMEGDHIDITGSSVRIDDVPGFQASIHFRVHPDWQIEPHVDWLDIASGLSLAVEDRIYKAGLERVIRVKDAKQLDEGEFLVPVSFTPAMTSSKSRNRKKRRNNPDGVSTSSLARNLKF